MKPALTVSLQDLTSLFKNCPKIQELDLENCKSLTDTDISQLPQGITSLNLRVCPKDKAISLLPKAITSLNL